MKILTMIAAAVLVEVLAVPASAEPTVQHPWRHEHAFKNNSFQISCAQDRVRRTRLLYAEYDGFTGTFWSELNSGATFRLVPCRNRDAWNCFWQSPGDLDVNESYANIRGRVDRRTIRNDGDEG